MGPKSAKAANYLGILRVYLENPGYTWKRPGILPISSVSPFRLCPRPALRLRETRELPEEHQTPSVFPGNFRKRKVLGTLSFLVSGNMDTGQIHTVRPLMEHFDVSEINKYSLERVNLLWASSGRTTELCLRCPTVSAPYSLS